MSEINKLKIHNWGKWQSYRADRGQPPWIKIHRELMRNIEWVSFTDAQRGQLVAIWLLAADHNGVIPTSPKIIQKLCHMDSEPDINLFIINGFIDGVIVASDERQHDAPEKRREETETEKKQSRVEKKETTAFALPDWIDKSVWDLWMQTRKGKKMIPAQMQAQVNKLQKWKDTGIDHAGALTASAEAGWSGLFEPKSQRGGTISSQSENDQIREAARKRIFGEKIIESI